MEGRSGSETGFAQAWRHWEIQLAAKQKDTGTHERGWKGRWERHFKAFPRKFLSLPFFKKTREKLLSHVQVSFILIHQTPSWRGEWGRGGASWWCVITGAFDPCPGSRVLLQLYHPGAGQGAIPPSLSLPALGLSLMHKKGQGLGPGYCMEVPEMPGTFSSWRVRLSSLSQRCRGKGFEEQQPHSHFWVKCSGSKTLTETWKFQPFKCTVRLPSTHRKPHLTAFSIC